MSEKQTLTHICLGDRIRDNDPRMPNRILVVARFQGDRVIASKAWGDATHEARISLSRIYLDGKPRRSGWSLVR